MREMLQVRITLATSKEALATVLEDIESCLHVCRQNAPLDRECRDKVRTAQMRLVAVTACMTDLVKEMNRRDNERLTSDS